MTISINRFFVLNKMQKETSKFHDTAWELRATVFGRSRTVSFIRKESKGYRVTMTDIVYPSFMAALASLVDFWINEVWKLTRSAVSLNKSNTDVTETVKRMLSRENPNEFQDNDTIDMSVPRLPTYDRGPKKEYLHPLRKAVTRWFGGKYSR